MSSFCPVFTPRDQMTNQTKMGVPEERPGTKLDKEKHPTEYDRQRLGRVSKGSTRAIFPLAVNTRSDADKEGHKRNEEEPRRHRHFHQICDLQRDWSEPRVQVQDGPSVCQRTVVAAAAAVAIAACGRTTP